MIGNVLATSYRCWHLYKYKVQINLELTAPYPFVHAQVTGAIIKALKSSPCLSALPIPSLLLNNSELLPMTATLMALVAELLLYLSYDMVVPRSPSHARVPCTNTYCAHIYRYTNELFF
uniref:Uncharacterized protein n=1 Tax=Glossina pallidipes TaxID=7398 RepID=A0A1B0AE53_GLOPL